jgi:hypothetical protein
MLSFYPFDTGEVMISHKSPFSTEVRVGDIDGVEPEVGCIGQALPVSRAG